ncbi:MAG: hypothetical protein HKN68_00280 [Saprospiraceae bacterium]|nr:hypothetical protein [Saprospiraceae bacterium]
MHRFIIFVFALFLYNTGFGQDTITEADFTGTWEARVSSSREKSMDMLFDGSTITIHADGTYSGNITQEISGNWRQEDGVLILDSDDLPFPLQLSEWSKDSCIWRLDKVNSSIPFFRINRDENSEPAIAEIKFIDVGPGEITGAWINTHAEVIGKSTKQNNFLFGESQLNDKLTLDKYGQFLMSGTVVKLKNEVLNGQWTLENGIITFSFESGETEQLGITKYTGDSLILEDLAERSLPMINSSKLRFIYTKEIAVGLRKYMIKPEVLDTFQADDLEIALMVPRDFEELYELEGWTVATFSFYKCSWCSSVDATIQSIKEDLTTGEKLVRFLDAPKDGFVTFEGKNHITGDIYYESSYIFKHKDEVYKINISSFLEENVLILNQSVADMKVISL